MTTKQNGVAVSF